MKKSLITWIVFTLLYMDAVICQTISISPINPSPSNLTIASPAVAGSKPIDPLINYIGQRIIYTAPFGWGNDLVVEVTSNTIPTGLSFIIQAANGSGGNEGISTGPVTVTSSYQPILTNIAKLRKAVTRQLTQSMIITDFSQLHPGQYSVTINLWIH